MTIRKLRLNRAEQARDFMILRQLQAEGLDLEIPELENFRAVDITVAGGADKLGLRFVERFLLRHSGAPGG